MNETTNGTRWSTLIGGIALIVVGGLFLAETLDLADFGDLFHDYWPMIVIAVGVAKLFDRERRGNGVTVIAIGLWLQISNLALFGLDWGSSWPVLLILLGTGIVVRALLDASSRRGRPEGDDPHAPRA